MHYGDDVYSWVRTYYGELLKGSRDLQTNACCAAEPPHWLQGALARVHPDIQARFYGCGFPVPEALAGCTVVDLGCGAGRDVYLLAQLVGEKGRVLGLDMTEAQLELAERHRAWHAERAGLAASNVSFHQGYIEDLSSLELEPGSVDVVVSNCVVNLSPRKDLVLREVHDLLKPGGEFHLSDVVADRRLDESLRRDPELYAECLGGALYRHDFEDLVKRVGFLDPRVVALRPIEISGDAVRRKVGAARFYSVTYRLFKLPELEPRCEDYGQIAVYRGGIPHHEDLFRLDDHHLFERGRPERVCGNTADMLSATRLAEYFAIDGGKDTHFGRFDCAGTLASGLYATSDAKNSGGCC
jgi:SAM-dependent methyltransferase